VSSLSSLPLPLLYIRFIGDKTIQEKDFGKIQKDKVSEMKKWARFLKRARDEEQRDRLNLVIVAANNHYAGFDPTTANPFRKMLDYQKRHGMRDFHASKINKALN
jgi:hypothetical protein